jgi:hypothetical protein
MTEKSKGMMKWWLIVAAVLVVLRVVLEQIGVPEVVNNVFGVAWLYFVVPIVFAFAISKSGEPKRFKVLVKNLLIFTTITRLMVMPTYWFAYALRWAAPRFSLDMGGVVGEGVTPLQGYLIVPIRNAVAWVVFATLLGMILGGITLLLRRKATEAQQPAE